jgi:hypothetical protein
MFLSRQYTRCTTCHFSPTGGGLLTPYGRSLARDELSTTGARHDATPDPSAPPAGGIDLMDNRLGPVSVGIDVRPAHLDVRFPGGKVTRDFLMTADLLAAYRNGPWTVYGEIGREPRTDGAKIDSYEYWVSHQGTKGFGVRVGRFLPAYGIRYSDHTAFSRAALGLDVYDQLYAVEVSHTGDRHRIDLTAGPGRADSILDDDGRKAFTAAARLQFDLNPRTVLVLSGLHRGKADLESRSQLAGLALGFAPARRLNTWTEANVLKVQGVDGSPSYTLVNETALEVYRGLWLKLSPQLRTEVGNSSAGTVRLGFGADLLPRARWNADVSYYRDRSRGEGGFVTKTLLAQLHLYL